MKEESRIVELLAEMLRKSDRHDELLEILIKGQLDLIDAQNKNNLSVGELRLSNMRLVEGLEKTNVAIEELKLSNIRLADGQLEPNKTLREIKVAIKDIARL